MGMHTQFSFLPLDFAITQLLLFSCLLLIMYLKALLSKIEFSIFPPKFFFFLYVLAFITVCLVFLKNMTCEPSSTNRLHGLLCLSECKFWGIIAGQVIRNHRDLNTAFLSIVQIQLASKSCWFCL